MNYYDIKQSLGLVDKNDRITGRADKWQAHLENRLHRGFTVIILYQNQVVFQHRKHPVFDGVYDLSFSSHPVYIKNRLQTDETAIFESLKREWFIEHADLVGLPKFLGSFYYQSKDPKSAYSEHEVDHIYEVEIKTLPKYNPDFAYGFELVDKLKIVNCKLEIKNNLAPWVKKILAMELFASSFSF